jgi:hypothetical protein
MTCQKAGEVTAKTRSKFLQLGAIFCTYSKVRRYLLYPSKQLYNPQQAGRYSHVWEDVWLSRVQKWLPLRHTREYFGIYQINIWRSQRMVLSMENVSWEIFGDMCEYGHVGRWDMFGKKWNVLTPQLDNIWRWV